MEEQKNPVVVFFVNLFNAVKLPFPPKKTAAKLEPVEPAVAVEGDTGKPGVVKFPRQSFTPLKLEAEGEEAERSTNPLLLWQVYAIGGFFVLRWAWTRWNEQKGQKKPDDASPPPPADN